MKRILWQGTSRKDLAAFPEVAKQRAGYALYQVQCGIEPADWKPMPSVGTGVTEIRIHDGREFRVVYVAKLEEGIYVLHAFEKKTQRTAPADIRIARTRLAAVLRKRGEWK